MSEHGGEGDKTVHKSMEDVSLLRIEKFVDTVIAHVSVPLCRCDIIPSESYAQPLLGTHSMLVSLNRG